MAPGMFSKLIPAAQGGRSFYEELRGRDDAYEADDRGRLLDEENLNHNFTDYDLENAAGLAVDDSHPMLDGRGHTTRGGRGHSRNGSRGAGRGSAWPVHDEEDNDVPASLLVEHHDEPAGLHGQQRRVRGGGHRGNAIPGPSRARAQWETAQAHQRLHNDEGSSAFRRNRDAPGTFLAGVISGSDKKKAEWRWANVSNLDHFVKDVYDYYLGCGIWCIVLERILHLLFVPPLVLRSSNR
jgi:autophagy-related protein 9